MEYRMRERNVSFKITVVYARCSSPERLKLREELEEIAMTTQVSWLVGGDFNTIMDESKKPGGFPVTQ